MGNNNVVKVEPKALTGALKVQSELMNELNVSSENNGVEFTDYGKKCVMNAISGLVTLATSQGIDFKQINGSMLKLALQNVGYTELNYAAMPSEVYFDLRKVRNQELNRAINDAYYTYKPDIKYPIVILNILTILKNGVLNYNNVQEGIIQALKKVNGGNIINFYDKEVFNTFT